MSLQKPKQKRHIVLTDADIIRLLTAGILFGLTVAILAPDMLRLLKSWL